MCDVTGLQIANHPVQWRAPISPGDLADPRLRLISGAALAAGSRADALIALDTDEAARRSDVRLGAVRDLGLLDALLGLPLGYPIRIDDLNEREKRILRDAPDGCVDFDTTSATRTLQVPATVVAAVIHGTGWRAAMRRTAAFSAFAQRVVVLPREPKNAEILEAQLAGIGIWEEGIEGCHTEHLAPEAFAPIYFKAAGWRFAENAFDAALDAGLVQRPSTADCACC